MAAESLFESLRRRFNEPDGKWLTVSDQVDVLNLIDVAEAASILHQRQWKHNETPAERALREALSGLNRGERLRV